MDQQVKPTAAEIRRARADNPGTRERDLAAQLGISEAELVAAHCGNGVTRVMPRVNDLLKGLEAVGEVMALTRNESAVHEKIGVYDKIVTGEHSAMALGENIDLRIFPKIWAHGFAVEKRHEGEIRRSLQFFDKAGEAVHKIHLRAASNLYAYQKLVGELLSVNQKPGIDVVPPEPVVEAEPVIQQGDLIALRERWSRLKDVHEFFGMLRALKLGRRQALQMVGDDYAWRLDDGAVEAVFAQAVGQGLPIMCFVGNSGCIQIHSGPIRSVKPMGPWLNVLDETFHLHLRLDHIHEVWAVRKPASDGHVTSLEAYDREGRMIIQFFGQRHEGEGELAQWRVLAEGLPRIASTDAA
jgi:putative hemin transport protein